MAYAVTNLAGAQPIANTSTEQKHVLGTIVRAWDPTYGEGATTIENSMMLPLWLNLDRGPDELYE